MIFRSCLFYRYPPFYVMKHEFISPPLQRDDDHNSINEKCEFYYARVRRICGQVSLGYLWGFPVIDGEMFRAWWNYSANASCEYSPPTILPFSVHATSARSYSCGLQHNFFFEENISTGILGLFNCKIGCTSYSNLSHEWCNVRSGRKSHMFFFFRILFFQTVMDSRVHGRIQHMIITSSLFSLGDVLVL